MRCCSHCPLRILDEISGLEHIRRVNNFGFNDRWALKFHEKGWEIKTYSCDDLLTAFAKEDHLPVTTSNDDYTWCSNAEHIITRAVVHSSGHPIFGFKIRYSEVYEFDLATGKMQSKDVRNTGFIGLVIAFLGFVAILSPVSAHFVRSRRQPCMPA